ncbi:probably inactive leucine-rich repeat receptor-like protein kinase At3g28040 [Durio zibethinus]|uniref:Probably inactive leucine-rich repeat receptor-like protein kinase At3g28040 n=1 Tax=Durio zibethinus TaxID=66656 RepID=A0A6P5Z0H6_DURZI|nr:probably inactive leucine-rich repeat receptor-like protein kinase At3g28040 [Durio zibethinus]
MKRHATRLQIEKGIGWNGRGTENSVTAIWDELRPKQMKVVWRRLIWCKMHVPKHAIIAWIAILNRLPTKDRLNAWGITNETAFYSFASYIERYVVGKRNSIGLNDRHTTMRAVTNSFFGFLFVIVATIISICDGNSNVLCIESERQALLKFKQNLIDRSNRLSSWVEGEDCCEWLHLGLHSSSPDVELDDEWDGYFQSAEWNAYFWSKLGGKINPSLIELKHLSFLDLSNNDFRGLAIPEFIGSMKSLIHLNLSLANFSRTIPHNLGNLSKLQCLDLGYNSFFEAKTLQWVSGLSSLQYLDLSHVDLGKATDWLQATHKLPSLVELHLSDCYLNNNDPSSIRVNYTSLAVLDLSSNMLSSIPTWIFSLRSIVSIDLSSNGVEGVILNGFQNISSLKFLDLSWNSFSSSSTLSWLSNLNQLQFLGLGDVGLKGNFSIANRNLSSLTHLDVSRNGIDQEVSEIIESLSRCCLDRLESLNIASNKLSGHLPDQLGQFKNLAYLFLSRNSISGPIPFSIGKLPSLKLLDVSYNQLNATLPQSLGQLRNLEHLDISNNMLEGNLSEMHFSKLTRLRLFWASNNLITFKPNPSWIPPFHCESIELRNWHIGPQFPQWLQFQKNLSRLAYLPLLKFRVSSPLDNPSGTQPSKALTGFLHWQSSMRTTITEIAAENGETPELKWRDSSEGRHRSKVKLAYGEHSG